MKAQDLPILKNYTPYIGDTLGRSFLIKRNGSPVDLSGDTFKMRIQDAITGEEFATLESGDGIENPSIGRVVWTITDEQTADFLPNRKYNYDLQWSRADGTTKTVQRGVMLPYKDITPA